MPMVQTTLHEHTWVGVAQHLDEGSQYICYGHGCPPLVLQVCAGGRGGNSVIHKWPLWELKLL
jgi:hypothetical protein